MKFSNTQNHSNDIDLEEEFVPYFKDQREKYMQIQAPREGLYAILEKLGEAPIQPSSRKVRTSWWHIGAVLVPSALLLIFMFGVNDANYDGSFFAPDRQNTVISKTLVDIEESVYNIEASDPFLEEEDHFLLALAEEDPTLAFNVNYYDDDF